MIGAVFLIFATLVGAATAAHAHQINLSSARIAIAPDRTVTVEIAIKGSDLDRVAGTGVYDNAADRVRPAVLAASAAPILGYVRRHTAVFGGDGAMCRSRAGSVAPDGDGVVTRIPWSCAGVPDPLRYRSTVLVDLSPDARQVVLLGAGSRAEQDLLDVSRTDTALTGAPPPGLFAVVLRFIGAGIEHIFLGYDHIAFLVSVVLWSRRLWPVVKIVTAFTLAHSITLSLAALGVVRIPSAIIEPAIAASIIYVAAENFLSRDVDKRWRITFCFGLIHGFGFASALEEFGLPRSALVPALASFNLGVEIGQIAIVSLVMPILLALDRLRAAGHRSATVAGRSGLVVYPISAVIVGLAGYWFLARTVLAT
jgi:hydrogenase/urease accessory protein HupE